MPQPSTVGNRSYMSPRSPVALPKAVSRRSVAETVVAMLRSLDVSAAFGVSGGAIAPIWAALSQSDIPVLHFRHESGAAFAAAESYFASGRPVVVFTTTGPGIFNALNGLAAARWEGAKLIFLSAFTSPHQRGRWAFQETSAQTTSMGEVFSAGPLFHYAAVLEQAAELPAVHRRLALGLAQRGGFVAHLSVPVTLQATEAQVTLSPLPVSPSPAGPGEATIAECARVLSEETAALWVGFGARDAAPAVRRLAERLGAGVMCSPRAKGIFPEDHPQFVGVTGFGGHDSVSEYVRAHRPQRVLVLGTRLGEFTSFWNPELVPPGGFIHVDVDPTVPGTAYPHAPTLAVQSDVGELIAALLPRLVDRPAPGSGAVRAVARAQAASVPPRDKGPVRPDLLMDHIQRAIVDKTDAVVISEAGNSFAWATHALRFNEPGRYRVSTGFGAMGQATTGVLGAALGRGGKAVAIVGDGAMLMNNEISTAVQHGIPVVWIVLNDARYNMCAQGNAFRELSAETAIPRADFVAIARGMGAGGVRVTEEAAVGPALARAMASEMPFVVDVEIDATVLSPAMRRFQSLKAEDGTVRRVVPAFG